MGVFDYIYLKCPHCGEQIEEQSKGGNSCQAQYTLENAPVDVIEYIINKEFFCNNCNTRFKIDKVLRPNYYTRVLNHSDEKHEGEY